MEKYMKALETLRKKFGCEWIKPAAEAVIEVAIEDYYAGGLSSQDYSEICRTYSKIVHPKNQERI